MDAPDPLKDCEPFPFAKLKYDDGEVAYVSYTVPGLLDLQYLNRLFKGLDTKDSPNPFFKLPILYGKDDGFDEYRFTERRDPAKAQLHNVTKDSHAWDADQDYGPFAAAFLDADIVATFVAPSPIFAFDQAGELISPPLSSYTAGPDTALTTADIYSKPAYNDKLASIPHPSAWRPDEHSLEPAEGLRCPIMTEIQAAPTAPGLITRPASLVELSMRVIANEAKTFADEEEQCDFIKILNIISNSSPKYMRRHIAAIIDGASTTGGLKTCAGCKGPFLTKAAEWLEFWQFDVAKDPREPTEDYVSGGVVKVTEPTLAYANVNALLFNHRLTGDITLPINPNVLTTTNPAGSQKEDEDAAQEEVLRRLTAAVHSQADRFVMRYAASVGSKTSIVPILREACSWDCAETWMAAWDAARKEDKRIFLEEQDKKRKERQMELEAATSSYSAFQEYILKYENLKRAPIM